MDTGLIKKSQGFMDLRDIRKEYQLKYLDEAALNADPIAQFLVWMQEALHAKLIEPTAMSLATCTKEGMPSCRIVLLKNIDSKGLVFFTNFESRKARELKQNPNAAVTFWWGELERQVRIEGYVERISDQEAEDYFSKRPRPSQLGSWASTKQSDVIPSRTILESELKRYEQEFNNKSIPKPPYWGGFRIVPRNFEFWQGRQNRLHDRLVYTLCGSAWNISRLSP